MTHEEIALDLARRHETSSKMPEFAYLGFDQINALDKTKVSSNGRGEYWINGMQIVPVQRRNHINVG